jgi:hypothetical protein
VPGAALLVHGLPAPVQQARNISRGERPALGLEQLTLGLRATQQRREQWGR